ncbi:MULTISPECIES: hypothetical protein [unclassified Streptomyces]|uniref:hypothetical protein n=1 Tax=unclassified Streptomyces TaxID=2593676 RepID=UPI00338D5AA9
MVPTVNCSATVARMIAQRADDRTGGHLASTASSRSPTSSAAEWRRVLRGTTSCGALCVATSGMPTLRRPL